MKKIFFSGLLCSVLCITSTQCLVGASFFPSYPKVKTFSYYWPSSPRVMPMASLPCIPTPAVCAENNDTAFLLLLAGVSLAGICYAVTCLPDWRLSSAQNTYNSFDPQLAEIIAYVDQHTVNFELLGARLYPCSAYPLVTMFNVLSSARTEAQGAVDSLDAALWWSQKEPFVRSCKHLKKLLIERLQLLEKCITSLRLETAWTAQYSLYLQQCNNERLESLERAVWAQSMNSHRCHTNTVIVPVQVP